MHRYNIAIIGCIAPGSQTQGTSVHALRIEFSSNISSLSPKARNGVIVGIFDPIASVLVER
jgi:hypothetical protein